MPRPAVPPPKDVIDIVKGLKASGIAFGIIRCADGTEIEWGEAPKKAAVTPLEKWRANRDAS